MSTCRLQHGDSYFSELDYESEFKLRILDDLVNVWYRKNDYNSGTQLQRLKILPHHLLWPPIGQRKLDRESKEFNSALRYGLNDAANAHDYIIYAAALNEEEAIKRPF